MSKKKITIRLNEELIEFVENYAKANNITIANVFELAILSMKNKGEYVSKDDLMKFLINNIGVAATTMKKIVESNKNDVAIQSASMQS